MLSEIFFAILCWYCLLTFVLLTIRFSLSLLYKDFSLCLQLTKKICSMSNAWHNSLPAAPPKCQTTSYHAEWDQPLRRNLDKAARMHDDVALGGHDTFFRSNVFFWIKITTKPAARFGWVWRWELRESQSFANWNSSHVVAGLPCTAIRHCSNMCLLWFPADRWDVLHIYTYGF